MDPETISAVDIIAGIVAIGGALSGALAFWSGQRERRLKAEAEKKAQEVRLVEVGQAGQLAAGDYLGDVSSAYSVLSQALELRIRTLSESLSKIQAKSDILEEKYNTLFLENIELRGRVVNLEKENVYLEEIVGVKVARIAALEARISELEKGNGVGG